MKILVVNAGSSSLKYQLVDMDKNEVLAKGVCERVGGEGSSVTHKRPGKEKYVEMLPIADHNAAMALVMKLLTDRELGVIADVSEIDAVGHRAAHGGKLSGAVVVTEEVLRYFESIVELNPLHGPPAIAGMRACMKLMPGKTNVVLPDTAYYFTMPPKSYIYPIPYEYYEKYQVRKYGFHGTSHRYVCGKVAEILGKPLDTLKIITCHIGSGSSITATMYGKAVDTSMGFTPQDGVPMGTRSGAIDPTIPSFLQKKLGVGPDEVESILNNKSGLLGVSGLSNDCLKVLIAGQEGNERCQLAMDILYQSVKKIIGSYMAEMNGADVVVFTAGIGENDKIVRENICRDMDFLGMKMDEEANRNSQRGEFADITAKDSRVKILVIPTDEEMMIAMETARLAKGNA
ncbi:MAG: acetate kinase [Clostridia bacterium]|nr:acetate kinase [Clostridia bacterium]